MGLKFDGAATCGLKVDGSETGGGWSRAACFRGSDQTRGCGLPPADGHRRPCPCTCRPCPCPPRQVIGSPSAAEVAAVPSDKARAYLASMPYFPKQGEGAPPGIRGCVGSVRAAWPQRSAEQSSVSAAPHAPPACCSPCAAPPSLPPADMRQYFPAASPPAIDLLDRLLTFDPGEKPVWGSAAGRRWLAGGLRACCWREAACSWPGPVPAAG